MIVDAALRGSAVGGLVGEYGVLAAELAASYMLVHTAVEIVAYTDIYGLLGLGIKDTVFSLRCGNFTGISGVKR